MRQTSLDGAFRFSDIVAWPVGACIVPLRRSRDAARGFLTIHERPFNHMVLARGSKR